MQLLRTIAIIVIVIYGFRLLTRYVFPFLFKRWVQKKQREFQQQFGGQSQFTSQEQARQFTKEHEGEVKIKSSGKNKGNESDDMGEYVDFEEVD